MNAMNNTHTHMNKLTHTCPLSQMTSLCFLFYEGIMTELLHSRPISSPFFVSALSLISVSHTHKHTLHTHTHTSGLDYKVKYVHSV